MRLSGQILYRDNLKKAIKEVSAGEVDAIERAVFTCAYRIHREAVTSIQSGARSGRTYTRGRIKHQASAPGEAPKTDTGRLVGSVYVKIDVTETNIRSASVGTDLVYGRTLELGSKNMQPRPWLFPAFEKTKQENKKIIFDSIDKALKASGKGGK